MRQFPWPGAGDRQESEAQGNDSCGRDLGQRDWAVSRDAATRTLSRGGADHIAQELDRGGEPIAGADGLRRIDLRVRDRGVPESLPVTRRQIGGIQADFVDGLFGPAE
jgi:hypothetical protein